MIIFLNVDNNTVINIGGDILCIRDPRQNFQENSLKFKENDNFKAFKL